MDTINIQLFDNQNVNQPSTKALQHDITNEVHNENYLQELLKQLNYFGITRNYSYPYSHQIPHKNMQQSC